MRGEEPSSIAFLFLNINLTDIFLQHALKLIFDIVDELVIHTGRFFIDELDAVGRDLVHARKKPMAEDVDYAAVAAMTDGMVGVMLANIVEVAAINMMRDGRTEIEPESQTRLLERDHGHRRCLVSF
ncbi:probable inactive ATP-dependent zinc metalloprotease FTSHI 2, chloroplastic [Tanacetum coccineum]